MKTTFIKGLIAEEIAKFHFENMGFNMIHTGKESLDKDLANEANGFKKFKNIENENTFNLYDTILAKLPDFMVWKKENNLFEQKFIEVKYRRSLPNIDYTNKGFQYIVNNDGTKDSLDLKKYFKNIDNLFSLLINTKNKWIDLYVYLVLGNEKDSKPNIYYGKVWKNDNGYKVDFLSIDCIDKSPNISNNWPNYKKIANHILSKKSLFELFEQSELMIRNSDDEIKKIIQEKISL